MSRRPGCTGAGKSRNLRVLVDMDGVLSDFEGWFLEKYRERYPDDPYVPLSYRHGFYVDKQYVRIRDDLQAKVRSIIEAEGFFREMPPIDGAIDAMKQMSGLDGVDAFLCTTPVTTTSYSITEKFEWAQHHLGQDWVRHMVFTTDKTIVSGDILIDDRPEIKGVEKRPSWDHILFTSCHNRRLDITRSSCTLCTQRLNNWTDGSWQQLIQEYKQKSI